MSNRLSHLRRACLATITVLSIGFGAVQAFATPSSAFDTRRACNNTTCDESCIAAGYALGVCTSKGLCRCYY